MQQMPQFDDVSSDMTQRGRQLQITINHQTAARFGITSSTVDNALYDAFGQRIASTFYTQTNQYRVIMNADMKDVRSINETIAGIYLPSSTATTGEVPLSAIVTLTEKNGPLQIEHLGQFPSISISFNLARGASLGSAVDEITHAEADIGLPESFTTAYQGALSAFQKSLSNELLLIIAAVVAVYIVLGVLYESFLHPITILSTLPSAGIGALLALRLVGDDLDIIGIIGIILLIGIVKKNAIMMIDFAIEAERVEGKSAARGDPPGLSAALPSDPDDDDGRSAGRAAADARLRHRIGASPAARHLHRRRTAGQPVADPVHHPCRLSGDRPDGVALPTACRRSSRSGRCRPSEHLSALHRPSGRPRPC